MNSTTTYWLCRTPEADPEGPFSLGQLGKMHEAGSVTAASLVCRQGEDVWYGLDDELAACDLEAGREPAFIPPTLQMAPVRKKRRSKGSGCGAVFCFLLGLVMLLLFWPVGLLLIVAALIIDHTSYETTCGRCGNSVAPRSRLCPTCKVPLK